MAELVFRPSAEADLARLDSQVRKRIIKKLKWLAKQANPLFYAKKLQISDGAQFRFRIGDWPSVIYL